MEQLTPYKIQRIMDRFPWKRRKPRVVDEKSSAIKYRNSQGQLLWATSDDLAKFADPTPALLHVALSNEDSGRAVIFALVQHYLEQEGRSLPRELKSATKEGIEIIASIVQQSSVEPEDTLFNHRLTELLTVTWAFACAVYFQERSLL